MTARFIIKLMVNCHHVDTSVHAPSLGAIYIGIKGIMFVASNILKAFPRLASAVESLRLMIPGGA